MLGLLSRPSLPQGKSVTHVSERAPPMSPVRTPFARGGKDAGLAEPGRRDVIFSPPCEGGLGGWDMGSDSPGIPRLGLWVKCVGHSAYQGGPFCRAFSEQRRGFIV